MNYLKIAVLLIPNALFCMQSCADTGDEKIILKIEDDLLVYELPNQKINRPSPNRFILKKLPDVNPNWTGTMHTVHMLNNSLCIFSERDSETHRTVHIAFMGNPPRDGKLRDIAVIRLPHEQAYDAAFVQEDIKLVSFYNNDPFTLDADF